MGVGLIGEYSKIMGELEEISSWGVLDRYAPENDPVRREKVVMLERARRISGVSL